MSATVKISHKTHPHSPTKDIYAKKPYAKLHIKPHGIYRPSTFFNTFRTQKKPQGKRIIPHLTVDFIR